MADIKIKCPKCRSDEFEIPRENLRGTDKLTCVKCGFKATYAKLVEPQAMKMAKDALAKALKGFK